MRTCRTTLGLAIAALAFASSSSALTPSQIGRCLDSTGHSALPTDSIMQGLVLTGDQKRELRARLSTFDSVRGFEGLDGIGLTAEQTALIQKRLNAVIAERKAHGPGWPCPAFKNPAKSIALVRSTLVYNGFRPAMWIKLVTPRQIAFRAIQDGVTYYGTAAVVGPHKIKMALTSTHNGGDSAVLSTAFIP